MPQPQEPRRRRILRAIATIVVLSLLGTAGAIAYANQRYIEDQITVWQFEPSAAVIAHEQRLQLTEHGSFLYRASRPVVSSTEEFATECPQQEDESAYGILGCYFPSTGLIYLFDVTDERLDGTEEVTAAHEMLHAAWDRMSGEEHAELSALLEVEFVRLSTDPAFVERMEFYARTEPGQRANELHSIIGTEAGGISAALEEHYARYFVDRTIVTALHETSNAVFVQLQARGKELVAAMEALRVSVDSDYASYTAGYATLNADIESFNERVDNGTYTSQSRFDRERNALMARRTTLDALYVSITARSAQYETLRLELETVNATSAELQQGLNIGAEVGSDL